VRITPAQQLARDTLWAKFGIDFQESILDLETSFAKAQPVVMEIGYGMGEATWQIAQANPNTNYLGVEVHMPGVGKLMAKLNEFELTNVKLIERDVLEVFHYMIADAALDGVHLYFPDPWPKKRHFKRRIVNQRFIAEVAKKLKPGGYLHIATDWVPYAEWITEQFNETTLFTGGVIDRPDSRPLTRFEGQGITKDHAVNDFMYYKK
jgi:tRNA (guanine-N7-)-methyltransferase